MANVTSGLAPYSGPWNQDAVQHLLRRTTFGAKRDTTSSFLSLGLQGSINKLLDDSIPLPQPPLKDYNPSTAAVPDTSILAGTTWVNDPATDGTVAFLRRSSFKKWWVLNMVNQRDTLVEKMTMFWHNHFSTETNDIGNAQYVYKHHALLRANALGNVKSLVKSITLDPAMLVYLNGQNNIKTAPDENYGREIQELFVIGKGPGSQYTEADVKAAAKLLTGWRINSTKIDSYFDITRHDTTDKQFSSFYSNKKITGRTSATAGLDELNDFIDMLFGVEEAALFLCRKLYTWFVYYQITPEIEASVIVPLAQILRTNNYDVKPVLRVLLSSEHFFDINSRACQIKSPVDMLIGMLREFEVPFSSPSQYLIDYGLANLIVSYLTNLQQNIGDPPDVSGWKAYYQEPGFYEYWINSDTLPKRIQYLDYLVNTGYTYSGFKMIIDGIAYTKKFSKPGDPVKLIDDMVAHVIPLGLSPSHKAQIKKDILLTGQSSDYYWTTAWDTYIANPANVTNTKYVVSALTKLITYLVDLSEYQLN